MMFPLLNFMDYRLQARATHQQVEIKDYSVKTVQRRFSAGSGLKVFMDLAREIAAGNVVLTQTMEKEENERIK